MQQQRPNPWPRLESEFSARTARLILSEIHFRLIRKIGGGLDAIAEVLQFLAASERVAAPLQALEVEEQMISLPVWVL